MGTSSPTYREKHTIAQTTVAKGNNRGKSSVKN